MADKNLDRLEKLRQKREQLNARIAQEAARERARAKQERGAKLLLWGEVVEALIKSGEMNPALWEAHCRKHLPVGRKLDAALNGLRLAPESPAKEETPSSEVANIPQDKATGTGYF